MTDTRITVTSYAGSRGEEKPRAFVSEGADIRVENILRQWVEEDFLTRRRKRFFQVSGSDGLVYLIYYDVVMQQWFARYREPGPPRR